MWYLVIKLECYIRKTKMQVIKKIHLSSAVYDYVLELTSLCVLNQAELSSSLLPRGKCTLSNIV